MLDDGNGVEELVREIAAVRAAKVRKAKSFCFHNPALY